MTGWSHNAGSVSGVYNAAYDVWFNNSASDVSGPTGAFRRYRRRILVRLDWNRAWRRSDRKLRAHTEYAE